ncbi:hypothetical protein AB0420_02450 [Streptomyces caelestis]|uniref:hypothetical protein n=1 Tax=Streptomyces caelestis TaxID=36816 RepID=UPI00344CB29C
MGDTERPIPEREGDQEEQAQHLTRTGNGPTVDGESELLAERHGRPDMSGVYSGPELVDQDDAEPADDTAEAAAEPVVEGEPAEPDTAVPAADSSEGGESA